MQDSDCPISRPFCTKTPYNNEGQCKGMEFISIPIFAFFIVYEIVYIGVAIWRENYNSSLIFRTLSIYGKSIWMLRHGTWACFRWNYLQRGFEPILQYFCRSRRYWTFSIWMLQTWRSFNWRLFQRRYSRNSKIPGCTHTLQSR